LPGPTPDPVPNNVPNLQVFPDPESASRAAAEVFVGAAMKAADDGARFTVALSGGSTPRSLYQRLASPGYADRTPWESFHVFWGDERCVPPVDEASDYRMAKETLLDHVPIPPGRVHRIRGEDPPAQAALDYEAMLRRSFGVLEGPPVGDGAGFDLVLLGMGEDGHTASLFPGTDAVHETVRWVSHVQADVSPRNRVTLTPPVLNAATRKLFLVTGVSKAPSLARVVEGPHDPDAFPSQAIEGAAWFVDAAAASMLSG
jgi:6-phosphogluconolactonase